MHANKNSDLENMYSDLENTAPLKLTNSNTHQTVCHVHTETQLSYDDSGWHALGTADGH